MATRQKVTCGLSAAFGRATITQPILVCRGGSTSPRYTRCAFVCQFHVAEWRTISRFLC